jgi:hypothetical protein
MAPRRRKRTGEAIRAGHDNDTRVPLSGRYMPSIMLNMMLGIVMS